MRFALLLFGVLTAAYANASQPFAQCVELPYPAMPRQFWERELVWMKNIGASCVAVPDSPDLLYIVSIARKLELPLWILAEQRAAALRESLEPLTEAHGGPVRWIGFHTAPEPVTRISAMDVHALALSRAAFEKQAGTILWVDVESTDVPSPHRGAISFVGEEQLPLTAMRRGLQLLRQWQSLLGQLTAEQPVRAAISAKQFTTPDPLSASIVSLINTGASEFRGELRVLYPPAKQLIKLPELTLPAGGSLWLPVNMPLAKAQSCTACAPFGNEESIVYATAELTRVEYENGILAMEFSSPAASEIVLHLASEPVGPYLAAGKPRSFDWDAATGRVRLPIPAGTGLAHRVRVGLALTAPETSAFFAERKVLAIGQPNVVTATFSSEAVAKRSRLIAPAWLKQEMRSTSPNEVEYTLTVPASAPHGSHADLSLETDGAQVAHTRLQLLRPVTLKIREAVIRHAGAGFELALEPPLAPVDQKSGRDLSVTVRNNAPEIRTFVLTVTGNSLEFAQARTEVVVAGSSERDVTVRVFADHAAPGLHNATLRITGGAVTEMPIRLLVIPRGESVRYTDGGTTIWESQRVRVVFTAARLLEFVWKDSERNVLPEGGLPLNGARIADLRGSELTVEGAKLNWKPVKQGDIAIGIASREGGATAYTLSR